MKTKNERIKEAILKDKELLNRLQRQTDIDNFIWHCERYIKAIKEGRVICVIDSVSSSGMSRTIKFLACEGKRGNFRYGQFWTLFKCLGYQEASRSRDTFRIYGCGMDMVFHTNYSIIHTLGRLGFLNKKQVAKLAQNTPTTV